MISRRFFAHKKPERLPRFERQWPGAPFSARGMRAKKKPAASYSRTGGSRTTLGDGALDFSVRNGNWYFCPSMATGMKAVSLETKEKYNVKRERSRASLLVKSNNKLSHTPY